MNVEFDETRIEVPLELAEVDELCRFWEDIFEVSYESFAAVLAGAERGLNRNILYLARDERLLVATTQLTHSCGNPRLGGLGEVATRPSHRRSGLAKELCLRARDEFFASGGEALFLGTHNPAAAQLYYQLGWRRLASTNVMCSTTGKQSVEEFLTDYFRPQDSVTVAVGNPVQRLPVIPLVVSPHDSQILDANLQLVSTRHALQRSCMSLFPRFAQINSKNGQWFAATTSDGRLVGLGTACRREEQRVQIDAFAHRNFGPAASELLRSCLRWASDQGAKQCFARLAQRQCNKHHLFESLGFSPSDDKSELEIAGTTILTRVFSRECSA